MIQWNPDETAITLPHNTVVDLALIPKMFHSLLQRANQLIAELMQGHSTAFPAGISPDKLVDDRSNRSAGYSLLSDHALQMWSIRKRNLETFMANHTDVVVTASGKLVEWRGMLKPMQKFMDQCLELNDIFLVLFHLGGGTPSRGTELLTLTYRNTSDVQCTLFAPQGQLSWTLAYSKASEFWLKC